MHTVKIINHLSFSWCSLRKHRSPYTVPFLYLSAAIIHLSHYQFSKSFSPLSFFRICACAPVCSSVNMQIDSRAVRPWQKPTGVERSISTIIERNKLGRLNKDTKARWASRASSFLSTEKYIWYFLKAVMRGETYLETIKWMPAVLKYVLKQNMTTFFLFWLR